MASKTRNKLRALWLRTIFFSKYTVLSHEAWAVVVTLSILVAWIASLSHFLLLFLFVALLLAMGVVFSYLWAESRQRIVLNERWQALTWTHYRRLFSETMVRSCAPDGFPQFDFVTFYNGQFAQMLSVGFFSELQYSLRSKTNLDLIICDIEYLDDLRAGVTFAPDEGGIIYKPVPLEKFLSKKETIVLLQQFLSGSNTKPLETKFLIPEPFAQILQPQSATFGIPLRWGYTGVAVKLSNASKAELDRSGFSFDNQPHFDLEWLVETSHPLHRLLSDGRTHAKIVMLDWYLPTMLLLAWYRFGSGYQNLQQARFEQITNDLNKLLPLMHHEEPLVQDPLQLAMRLEKEEDLIIVGGGNWLLRSGRDQSPTLKLLPIKSGYLLWCECLVFLAPESEARGVNISKEWGDDAIRLIHWFMERSSEFSKESAFQAFEPSNTQFLKDFKHMSVIRKLPPKDHADYICRDKWAAAWEAWTRKTKTQNAI